MKAVEVMDLRKIFRFARYRHAVPIVALEAMEFDPATDDQGDELGILWLRPRENYPFYLRESSYLYDQKQTVTKSVAERQFDGDPTDHVVAIAILRPKARWEYGLFSRRTWWVKSYDAFHGYRPYKNRDGTITWYDRGGPSEAVIPTLIPNQESKDGWINGAHSILRAWDGTEPRMQHIR